MNENPRSHKLPKNDLRKGISTIDAEISTCKGQISIGSHIQIPIPKYIFNKEGKDWRIGLTSNISSCVRRQESNSTHKIFRVPHLTLRNE